MIEMKSQFAFFDSAKVTRSVDRARRRSLSRAGGLLRTTARRSIRKRKGISAPGKPPSSHTGDLKRIFFGYDKSRDSVLVGPLGFRKRKAPSTLEHGGYITVMKRDKRGRMRKVKVKVQPRPYMNPALEKVKTKYPEKFKSSVKA